LEPPLRFAFQLVQLRLPPSRWIGRCEFDVSRTIAVVQLGPGLVFLQPAVELNYNPIDSLRPQFGGQNGVAQGSNEFVV
jgi:hypothetical protein